MRCLCTKEERFKFLARYQVTFNDTPASIAESHNMSIEELILLNSDYKLNNVARQNEPTTWQGRIKQHTLDGQGTDILMDNRSAKGDWSKKKFGAQGGPRHVVVHKKWNIDRAHPDKLLDVDICDCPFCFEHCITRLTVRNLSHICMFDYSLRPNTLLMFVDQQEMHMRTGQEAAIKEGKVAEFNTLMDRWGVGFQIKAEAPDIKGKKAGGRGKGKEHTDRQKTVYKVVSFDGSVARKMLAALAGEKCVCIISHLTRFVL